MTPKETFLPLNQQTIGLDCNEPIHYSASGRSKDLRESQRIKGYIEQTRDLSMGKKTEAKA